MALVSIGLGTNLGDREGNLRSAYGQLSEQCQVKTLQVSRVYQTPPLGPPDQPDYLNAAVLIETTLQPEQLLALIKTIESNMGRVTRRRWGERIIDLDILLYDDSCFDLPGLTIPHKGIAQRSFVIEPLIDLYGPDHEVPGVGDLATLRARLSDAQISLFSCAPLSDNPSNPARSTSD